MFVFGTIEDTPNIIRTGCKNFTEHVMFFKSRTADSNFYYYCMIGHEQGHDGKQDRRGETSVFDLQSPLYQLFPQGPARKSVKL